MYVHVCQSVCNLINLFNIVLFFTVLASSGIDYDIKVWAPLREEPFFDVEKANEVCFSTLFI